MDGRRGEGSSTRVPRDIEEISSRCNHYDYEMPWFGPFDVPPFPEVPFNTLNATGPREVIGIRKAYRTSTFMSAARTKCFDKRLNFKPEDFETREFDDDSNVFNTEFLQEEDDGGLTLAEAAVEAEELETMAELWDDNKEAILGQCIDGYDDAKPLDQLHLRQDYELVMELVENEKDDLVAFVKTYRSNLLAALARAAPDIYQVTNAGNIQPLGRYVLGPGMLMQFAVEDVRVETIIAILYLAWRDSPALKSAFSVLDKTLDLKDYRRLLLTGPDISNGRGDAVYAFGPPKIPQLHTVVTDLAEALQREVVEAAKEGRTMAVPSSALAPASQTPIYVGQTGDLVGRFARHHETGANRLVEGMRQEYPFDTWVHKVVVQFRRPSGRRMQPRHRMAVEHTILCLFRLCSSEADLSGSRLNVNVLDRTVPYVTLLPGSTLQLLLLVFDEVCKNNPATRFPLARDSVLWTEIVHQITDVHCAPRTLHDLLLGRDRNRSCVIGRVPRSYLQRTLDREAAGQNDGVLPASQDLLDRGCVQTYYKGGVKDPRVAGEELRVQVGEAYERVKQRIEQAAATGDIIK